jgi:predicted transcriptional regulator
MNRIEKSIMESFSVNSKQSLSEIVKNTEIPRGTVKKYIPILIKSTKKQIQFWKFFG